MVPKPFSQIQETLLSSYSELAQHALVYSPAILHMWPTRDQSTTRATPLLLSSGVEDLQDTTSSCLPALQYLPESCWSSTIKLEDRRPTCHVGEDSHQAPARFLEDRGEGRRYIDRFR